MFQKKEKKFAKSWVLSKAFEMLTFVPKDIFGFYPEAEDGHVLFISQSQSEWT